MKRFLSGMLALTMMLCFVWCGTAQQVKADEQEYTLIKWYLQKAIDNMDNQEHVEKVANELIHDKLDVTLHFELIDVASWDQKTKLMSATGEEVDLIFTATWTNRLTDNVKNGFFAPLDELLAQYGQDILAKVDERAWAAATFNGSIMAVPAQTPYSSPQDFAFRKDLVEKYNFDYKNCTTIADLEPFLEEVKQNESGVTPLLVTSTQLMPFDSPVISLATGVGYDEDQDKVIAYYSKEHTALIDAFRKINEYYQKGYIAKDAITKTENVAEAKTGKYAVMREAGGVTEDGSKSSTMYGFPCVETVVMYPMITTNSFINCCNAIANTSKHPDKAMQLLNLVWADPQISNTLAYGVEGEDYQVISGAGTDNPTVKANEGSEQRWAIWHNTLGPLWDQWDSNWNTKAALEQMQQDNLNAKASKLVGFTFDQTPVATQIATVSAVVQEITPIFYTGSMDDFDAFVEETEARLQTAGLDVIMEEARNQIDAWKATK